MINSEQNQTRRIITVSQLNTYVKSMLEGDFRLKNIFVTGEISNLKDHYSSGHIYLTLKDSSAAISSVMFAGNARNLRFKLENGMKVICHGRISIYEVNGQYQMYIDRIEPVGIGALYLAFEQLKKKLEAQGLFAEEHKKPIKRFPKTVAVITSPTGAVIQDIRNVISRRYPFIKIRLYPVTVQGEDAPAQIIEALNLVNSENIADTVIIARGGGSMEDLWAFNNENLALAVFKSEIPVISAVGHETDFTICDFVADLRAPTPSAAAELAVPSMYDLKTRLDYYHRYLNKLMLSYRYSNLKSLSSLHNELCFYAPVGSQSKSYQDFKNLMDKHRALMDKKLTTAENALNTYTAKLDGLNPVSVLSRGYAYIFKNNKKVQSVSSLKKGDEITVYLSDGSVKAEIK